MSARDLLTNPCWQAADLGHPLPDHPHAVSVALPRWQDVIDYEENNAACRAALRAAYPRFVPPPLVAELASQALAEHGAADGCAWPYPNQAAAEAALAHCQRVAPNAAAHIADSHGLPCLIADAAATSAAKAAWQHAGLGASSRLAATALGYEAATAAEAGRSARNTIKQRLADAYGCDAELVRVLPSGMAGLYTALQAISQLRPGRPTLQIGFPYVDVLKLPQALFAGGELLTDDRLSAIVDTLERSEPAAVIVELPSNPMLRCVDLPGLAREAHARGIPVIADDTIGSVLNIDVLRHVDVVFSSLTKSFAGTGDVLAGSLVISPGSAWRHPLAALTATPVAELADADAVALEAASRDWTERVPRLDANCQQLADRLAQHPAIARVLHPGQCANFAAIKRPGAGHGCLLSFELAGGTDSAKRVYDALAVNKGPSLGTSFTLACPYVLLAHYDELDWAESCGVPSHLLRVSVGLEHPDDLWQRFTTALAQA